MHPCRLEFSSASAHFSVHACKPRSWIRSQMLQRTMLLSFTKLPEIFVMTYRKGIAVLGIKGIIVATHGGPDYQKRKRKRVPERSKLNSQTTQSPWLQSLSSFSRPNSREYGKSLSQDLLVNLLDLKSSPLPKRSFSAPLSPEL